MRVVDCGNLYAFWLRNVELSARRDMVNILTHERFKFNWDNPTGHYRLETTKKVCLPSHEGDMPYTYKGGRALVT